MGRIPSLEAPMQLSPNRLLGAAALTVCLAAAGCATSPGYANDGYYGANAPTGACYNDCGTLTRIAVISGGGSAVTNAPAAGARGGGGWKSGRWGKREEGLGTCGGRRVLQKP